MSRPPSDTPDGPRKIIHVDMDAFFASVEQRDDPSLRGKPIVVGGSAGGRGVVAAASYEARKFGVRSAMPSSRAARLCPDLIFVKWRFDAYREASQAMRHILDDYSSLIEPLSIDECFLDVSADMAGLGSATITAEEIRTRIREELMLTASAGVAPVKFVAKIASDYRKPDGLTVVPPHRVLEFIHPLPVEKLWGVGPATATRLHAIGLRTIAEVAARDKDELRARLGRTGAHLWELANGRDDRPIVTSRKRKSRGAERTFAEDVTDMDKLRAVLADITTKVCEGLEAAGVPGRTVVLKLRYDDFTTLTRSRTLARDTADAALVTDVLTALMADTEAGRRPVRLIGMSVSNLRDAGGPHQLDLPLET